MRFSPPIDADTPGDFFRRSRRCGSFENSCDKIAQPDGLALLAIHSNKRRKSQERQYLANAGEFNRQYLTCQISAILNADRGDRRKSQSPHQAHLASFADGGDHRTKSPSVALALQCQKFIHSNQESLFVSSTVELSLIKLMAYRSMFDAHGSNLKLWVLSALI